MIQDTPDNAPSDPARTVLVTGCSSGFGRSMVDEFLARGWHVLAGMRRAGQRADVLAAPMASNPGRVTLVELELADPWEREAAVAAIRSHGRLDCLVNNAGYGLFGALEDLTEEQLRRQFEVNLVAPALLTRSLLPQLRASRGSVVFLSSAFGETGFPLTAAYCASKFGLEGLAESLYHELLPLGVRVALVEPGAHSTRFGANVAWGERSGEAYRARTEAYRRLKEKIGARARDRSAHVARLVADLAEGRARRLRTRVGMDAWLGRVFRALVPEPLRVPVTSRMYRKLLPGGDG